MRENLFELGSSLDEDSSWSADNKAPKNLTCKDIKPFNEHSLIFKTEKRRGKIVCLVGEFFIDERALKDLCKKWKKTLGVGGTYKEGFMEFQGQCCEKLKALVRQEGFRTKS
jgi:translation initiation factor 1